MKNKKKKTSCTTHKNTTKRILLSFAIIFFFFVLVLGSAIDIVFDRNSYFREQEKSNVYSNMNKSLAQNVTISLIEYFRYDEKLETDFFNEREASHLYDVKNLIRKLVFSYYSSIILMVIFFILYYKKTRDFSKSLSSLLVLGSIIVILFFIILSLIDFTFLFDKFHIIFFEDNYMFPHDSNIIMLFPESFFSGMFSIIGKASIIKAFILLMVGIFINSMSYFSRIQARP